jgi:predicted amidophosphoribosyltransferase
MLIQCSFCSKKFTEEEAILSCGNCTLFGGCRKVKCPHCGYETPQIPGLLKTLMSIGKHK